MCASGIKVVLLFNLGHSPTPLSTRSVGRTDSDSPLTDLALPISCNWLCILPFPWQPALRLPHRSPHAMFEGGTPSDFHISPHSMLGCLLTQRPSTRLYGLLGSKTTSAAWVFCLCNLFPCQVVAHTVCPLQAQADF